MSLEKFKLLCWKNFTLQKRHPIAALFEILFPILIVVIFSFARSNLNPTEYSEKKFNSFDPLNYNFCQTTTQQTFFKIGISPRGNPLIQKLINSSVGRSGWSIDYFDNATELNSFLIRESNTAGIEFSDELAVSFSVKLNIRSLSQVLPFNIFNDLLSI